MMGIPLVENEEDAELWKKIGMQFYERNPPMTEKTELLPCPFCGGAVSKIPETYGEYYGHSEFFACDKCTARTDSISEWNTRATPYPERCSTRCGELTATVTKSDYEALKQSHDRLVEALKAIDIDCYDGTFHPIDVRNLIQRTIAEAEGIEAHTEKLNDK